MTAVMGSEYDYFSSGMIAQDEDLEAPPDYSDVFTKSDVPPPPLEPAPPSVLISKDLVDAFGHSTEKVDLMIESPYLPTTMRVEVPIVATIEKLLEALQSHGRPETSGNQLFLCGKIYKEDEGKVLIEQMSFADYSQYINNSVMFLQWSPRRENRSPSITSPFADKNGIKRSESKQKVAKKLSFFSKKKKPEKRTSELWDA